VKRKTKPKVATTEHGRAAARLAPVEPAKRFPDLSRIRRRFKGREIALSQAVIDDRNGRL
jgi:antitoxin (DNA-binding transcriptional repressor) of toxin-antitoxin stability system